MQRSIKIGGTIAALFAVYVLLQSACSQPSEHLQNVSLGENNDLSDTDIYLLVAEGPLDAFDIKGPDTHYDRICELAKHRWLTRRHELYANSGAVSSDTALLILIRHGLLGIELLRHISDTTGMPAYSELSMQTKDLLRMLDTAWLAEYLNDVYLMPVSETPCNHRRLFVENCHMRELAEQHPTWQLRYEGK